MKVLAWSKNHLKLLSEIFILKKWEAYRFVNWRFLSFPVNCTITMFKFGYYWVNYNESPVYFSDFWSWSYCLFGLHLMSTFSIVYTRILYSNFLHFLMKLVYCLGSLSVAFRAVNEPLGKYIKTFAIQACWWRNSYFGNFRLTSSYKKILHFCSICFPSFVSFSGDRIGHFLCLHFYRVLTCE